MKKEELNLIKDKAVREYILALRWNEEYYRCQRDKEYECKKDSAYRNWQWAVGAYNCCILLIAELTKTISANVEVEIERIAKQRMKKGGE